MMRTGRFEPFPLRRAIALARAGSFAATVTGTPSASSTFLMYSTAFVSLPGGSCVSMRTSAWKWRSSSALAAVQSTAAGVGVPRAGTCAAVAWRRTTDAAATATAARIWLRFIAAILSWVAAQALQRHEHVGPRRFPVAERLVQRASLVAGRQSHGSVPGLEAPCMNRLHDGAREPVPPMRRLGVDVVDDRQAAGEVARPRRPGEGDDATAGDDVSPMLDEPRAVGAVRQVNARPRRECRAHRLRVDRYAHVLEHAQPMPDDRCDVGGRGVPDGVIGMKRQRHDAVPQCSAGAARGCP